MTYSAYSWAFAAASLPLLLAVHSRIPNLLPASEPCLLLSVSSLLSCWLYISPELSLIFLKPSSGSFSAVVTTSVAYSLPLRPQYSPLLRRPEEKRWLLFPRIRSLAEHLYLLILQCLFVYCFTVSAVLVVWCHAAVFVQVPSMPWCLFLLCSWCSTEFGWQ